MKAKNLSVFFPSRRPPGFRAMRPQNPIRAY